MQCKIYTLPEITFVGGKTQELRFNLVEQDGSYYNANHIQDADFSVCNYSMKTGEPLKVNINGDIIDFSLTPEKVTDTSSNYPHMYKVIIPPSYTKELFGKFIYQITLKDSAGKVEIPNQGILNITRNINQGFITP